MKIITQIGSLPLEDVDEAVRYSLKHDIPFLPELPKRGDAMLNYIKEPGNLSCLEKFKKHKFKTVKIQCVGPATLLLSGYNRDEALKRSYEHISAIMDDLQAEEIILFLDEPALGQSGVNYQELWDALFSSFKVIRGVHVCGDMDWDIMFASGIEIISFDASKYDITKYPKYRGGKRISWGVEKKEDVKDFKEGDLLTLPCGMGSPMYKAGDCEKNLRKLQNIAKEVLKGIEK
ncbi:MAG: hypothetical protein JSV93_02270 [Candidatus Omnitrophota bacterium]|nr:MAG: hypothetical protein JSV93_02270 [Candidatus Omnitrophota bacterium]